MKGRSEGGSKGTEGEAMNSYWGVIWTEVNSTLFPSTMETGFRMFAEPYLNWLCISQSCPPGLSHGSLISPEAAFKTILSSSIGVLQ